VLVGRPSLAAISVGGRGRPPHCAETRPTELFSYKVAVKHLIPIFVGALPDPPQRRVRPYSQNYLYDGNLVSRPGVPGDKAWDLTGMPVNHIVENWFDIR
jgi:hypothetical protein